MALVVEADRAQPSWRFRNRLVPVLGAAGLGLLGYLIAELGPARIVAQLHGLGSILPAVLVVTSAKYPLQTAGWRLALPRHARPPWGESISATITGDALGYLTWAGPFTGEPIRALLVRSSVPVAAGIAAGAVERAMYNVTAAVFVWAVLLFLVTTTHSLAFVTALIGSALGAVALAVLCAAACARSALRTVGILPPTGQRRRPDRSAAPGPFSRPRGSSGATDVERSQPSRSSVWPSMSFWSARRT